MPKVASPLSNKVTRRAKLTVVIVAALMLAVMVRPTSALARACVPRADWRYTYIVQSGDRLFRIALRIGSTTSILTAGNCLGNPSYLRIGQVLRLPNPLGMSVSPTPNPPAGAQRIAFAPGASSATVQGTLASNGSQRYVARANASQTLIVQVTIASDYARIQVTGPNGTDIPQTTNANKTFAAMLPTAGDYTITIIGGNAAPVPYTAIVTIR